MLLSQPLPMYATLFSFTPKRLYQTDFSDYSDAEHEDSNEAGLSSMRDEEFYTVQARSGAEVDDLDLVSEEERHAGLIDLSPSQIQSLSQGNFNKLIDEYL